jgi:tRNA U54 and U55 pseudouridine synthase Pus10
MDEALNSMLRKIIKEELSSVTNEVSDLKKEVKMLHTDLQKQLNIIQEQLKMTSENTKGEIPISINHRVTGMIEKKIGMKANQDLPDFPFWNQVLDKIEQTISKPSFETWLNGTNAKQLDETTIIVFSKNEFQAGWLEQRFESLIIDALKEVSDITFKIEFRS